MAKPTVSIILPTHNGTKYLRQSIESILGQTFQDIELIIVDDCSTDNTKEIVASYNDHRIRYIYNEKNLRLPSTLNVGFHASLGDYVTWTSDDNYFAPTAIEEMHAYLKNHQADFVYCDLYNVYVNEENKIKERPLQDAHRIKIEDCVGACFLYSRRVLETVGDYNADAELVEDYDYWIRVSLKFPLHHIKRPLYYYRYHDLSLWGTKYAQIQIMEFLLKFKYDFLTESETNWNLRGLKLKAKNDFSTGHKIINRFFYTSRIQKILKEFKSGQLLFKEARARLSSLIYGRPDDAKHFVFLRKFSPDWDWGGTETLLMDWFEKINFGKCHVTLVVPSGAKLIFEEKMLGKPWKVNIVEIPFSLQTSAWQRFHGMANFLAAIKPDKIIFVHGWYIDFRCAEFFAAWLRAKGQVYLHENGCPPILEKSSRTYCGVKGLGLWMHVQRFLVSSKSYFCKSIFTVSNGVKELLVNSWGYPRNKITVACHGVDVNRFSSLIETRVKLRKDWNIDDTAQVVFISSRLAQEKCIDRAIDAFDQAAADFPNTLLLIAGQGPLESALKEQAKNKKFFQKICFLGHIDNIADILKMSDIYVCSSEFESLGISLIEAMATGLICISTKCSGPTDIIQNEINGFLVEHNSDAIAQAMHKVFRLTATDKKIISDAARQTVLDRFNVDQNTTMLLEILQVPCKV